MRSHTRERNFPHSTDVYYSGSGNVTNGVVLTVAVTCLRTGLSTPVRADASRETQLGSDDSCFFLCLFTISTVVLLRDTPIITW